VGRKPKHGKPMKLVSFRIRPDVYDFYKRYADRAGITVSQLLKEFVTKWYEEKVKSEKEKENQ